MTTWADTFVGRTVASGSWGTASDGETWNLSQGSSSGLSVSAGEGICAASASNTQIMILGSNADSDIDVVMRFKAGSVGSTVATCDTVALFLRITDNTHYYRFDIGSLGSTALRIGKKTGGGFVQITSASSPVTLSANAFYWIRFRIRQTNLFGRIWADGSGEPNIWHISASDSSIASGGVGIGLNTNTTTGSTQQVDHFSAQTIVAYPSVILADSPKAYYRCNETTGSAAHDITSNHYDAALSGSFMLVQPGAVVGDNDTSILFTNPGSTLTVPYALSYTTFSAFSLEFWINVLGIWQHVAVTASGSTVIAYIQGIPYIAGSSAPTVISSIFDYAGSASAAYLDEIAIYNVALTSTQISNHITAAGYIVPPEPALLTLPAVNRRSGVATPINRRSGLVSPTNRRG